MFYATDENLMNLKQKRKWMTITVLDLIDLAMLLRDFMQEPIFYLFQETFGSIKPSFL